MALTLVQREAFQGVGTLSSGAPGNLGAVTGNFYKRAIGPRLTADSTANSLGWSVDMRIAAQTAHNLYHQITITSTAAEWLGMLSGFFYVDSYANNGANVTELSQVREGNGNALVGVYLNSTTPNFYTRKHGTNIGDSGVAVPIRQWFEMRLAWHNLTGTTGGSYLVSVSYRLCGT